MIYQHHFQLKVPIVPIDPSKPITPVLPGLPLGPGFPCGPRSPGPPGPPDKQSFNNNKNHITLAVENITIFGNTS